MAVPSASRRPGLATRARGCSFTFRPGWHDGRKRWLSVGEDVTDLIGPESADRFDVRPIAEAEVYAGADT